MAKRNTKRSKVKRAPAPAPKKAQRRAKKAAVKATSAKRAANAAPAAQTVAAAKVATGAPPKPKADYRGLSVDELRSRYNEIVGRPTGSRDRRYLLWKIREVETGRLPAGSVKRGRERAADEMVIIPLRLSSQDVASLDETWPTKGATTRSQFLRHAVAHYLQHLGATELAARFS